jgi:hypothetical protein
MAAFNSPSIPLPSVVVVPNNETVGGTLTVTGATTLSTVNMTGLLTVSGFGTSSFSAGGTGDNAVTIRNTTAGTTNTAYFAMGNDVSAGVLELYATSSTYTTAAPYYQDGVTLRSSRVGGLSIACTNASGAIRFYTGGSTEQWTINSGGDFLPSVTATHDIGTTTLGLRRVHIAGTDVIYAPNSSSNTGTAIVQASNNYWYRLTSSRRYKEHLSPFAVTDDQLRKFVALAPQHWDYIGAQTGAVGFIAEDLDGLGILNSYGRSPLVNYNEDGLVESNRDYSIIGLQHLVLQQHDATITQLTARIAALETKDH